MGWKDYRKNQSAGQRQGVFSEGRLQILSFFTLEKRWASYEDSDSLTWKRDDHGENPLALMNGVEVEEGTRSQGRTMKL